MSEVNNTLLEELLNTDAYIENKDTILAIINSCVFYDGLQEIIKKTESENIDIEDILSEDYLAFSSDYFTLCLDEDDVSVIDVNSQKAYNLFKKNTQTITNLAAKLDNNSAIFDDSLFLNFSSYVIREIRQSNEYFIKPYEYINRCLVGGVCPECGLLLSDTGIRVISDMHISDYEGKVRTSSNLTITECLDYEVLCGYCESSLSDLDIEIEYADITSY